MAGSIYLDYNATAPVRPQVMDAMAETLQAPANPSSAHSFGREAKKRLEEARKIIAEAISVFPREIIFTASGTEGNALALGGVDRRVLISAVEHSSVLKARGDAQVLPVNSEGIVKLEALREALQAGPALVSVMLANNETGVIQPIPEIAALCRAHGALLHVDAVQAFGKIPVDVGLLGADMLSLSAHKCGGPVGAAALAVRGNIPLTPLIRGGGQELGRRAGTENIAAIAGFSKAVELVNLNEMSSLRRWLDTMEQEMIQSGAIVFGKNAPRLPNTTCVALPGAESEVQLMEFDLSGFAISAGSACSSGRIEVSHVLKAMGVAPELARCAVRISAGWASQEEEIKKFREKWRIWSSRYAKK